MIDVINAYTKKKLGLLTKGKSVGFVVKKSPRADGFFAQMRAPKKIFTRVGQEISNVKLIPIKTIHGKVKITLEPVVVLTDEGVSLEIHLSIEDLESSFQWDLS